MELYGVSSEIVKPGLSFRELLLHRKESGSFFGDVDEYYGLVAANLRAGKLSSFIVHSSGGAPRARRQRTARRWRLDGDARGRHGAPEAS
jgi:hypothetical protein